MVAGPGKDFSKDTCDGLDTLSRFTTDAYGVVQKSPLYPREIFVCTKVNLDVGAALVNLFLVQRPSWPRDQVSHVRQNRPPPSTFLSGYRYDKIVAR